MKERIVCPHCGNTIDRYKNPLPTVDVIVVIGGKLVLIKRRNPPYGWALPGGFIDCGESAEEAAEREIREEVGIEIFNLKQFRCYSAPERDPRLHTITIVFTAESSGLPEAGDDAEEVGLFEEDALPSTLAFDHSRILKDYFRSRSEKML
ncbi:NUDIX domain-containing protein [Candidatus Latescibacterota bacterium]